MFCLVFFLNFVVADHQNALRGLSNDENSCSDGGCQSMQGTSNVSCSGGNCTLSECTKDGSCTDMGPCKSGCTCSGGQCNMSKATANASCSGGDCDMSSVTTNADCSGGNCKMDSCTEDFKCSGGDCNMPKCSKDCQCGGGCNMASCASGCSCVYKLCADGPVDLKPEQLCTMTKCDEAANTCTDSDQFLSGCWGHAGVGCKDIVKSAPNGKAGSSECAALGP